MQLDNDLLDQWLKCRQVADQDIKQMVETIQQQRNEIKELKNENKQEYINQLENEIEDLKEEIVSLDMDLRDKCS